MSATTLTLREVPLIDIGVDPEQRLPLYDLVSTEAAFVPRDVELSAECRFRANPDYLEKGLYIPQDDPIFYTASQTIRIGTHESSDNKTEARMAVVFPSDEYTIIDRDPIVSEKPSSLSLFALSKKIGAQTRLVKQLASERKDAISLHRAVDKQNNRYKAKNLERRRAEADEKFHETAELASLNLGLDRITVNGLHRAIRARLYAGNYSHDEFTNNWLGYIVMIGRHNAAKMYKLQLSIAQSERDFSMHRLLTDAA
ncbi:MAG TPA: hypothetical protein VLF79_01705 [Candidatus Saccharimonadales bacterium]|nr:hypothetical protein [Candidatus Saccharimonadales bacterium]